MLETGEWLAGESGADLDVVRLFAVSHDSKRVDEGRDPEHGPRAAEFTRTLQGRLFEIDDEALERLGRIGITPDPFYLGTDAPDLVTRDWGIDLATKKRGRPG